MKKILIVLFALTAFVGCSKEEQPSPDVDHYTCSMHPSVKAPDPGRCPICGMDLVPVLKKETENRRNGERENRGERDHKHGGTSLTSRFSHSPIHEFSVPVERLQQINVTYALVERRPLITTLRSVGIVDADKARTWEFVARVEGYVQELFVKSAGEKVTNGESLLTLYSPELLTTQREYLDLLRAHRRATSDVTRRSSERLLESARRRLRLWNVSEQEIEELGKRMKVSETLTLRSPFDGIVDQVPVEQGAQVKAGDKLISVLDPSVLWVWIEVYENELPLLKIGDEVTVTSTGAEKFEGTITTIDPVLDPVKRTARARIDVANPDYTLRPGMFVNASLQVERGDGITIPVGAVLPTGTRNLVFVDKGEGRLEPRFIEIGSRFSQFGGRYYDDYYEVRSGLVEGERVVASANFLIDAESKIQGALKTWAFEETENGEMGETGKDQ
jgi:RND family efflux transporter MFP subunit